MEAACARWRSWSSASLIPALSLQHAVVAFWIVCIVLAVALTSFPSFNPITKYGKASTSLKGQGVLAAIFVRACQRNNFCLSCITSVQNAKVAKSRFKEYYILAWLICVGLFVVQLSESAPYLQGTLPMGVIGQALQLGPFAAVLLWLIHLSRRWLECSYLHVWSDATMHIVVLIFGFLHYVGASLSLLLALGGACLSGDADTHGWLHPAALHSQGTTGQLVYAAGVALVLLGQVGQHAAHRQLAALRAPPVKGAPQSPAPAVGKYVLPQGGVFSISSSPHYTFEVCIYLGLALLCGGTAPMLMLLAWAAANLSLSAAATQQWYHSKFDTTPSKWAIFPGIF